MVTKAYTLGFDGYWREPNVSGLLAKSGVYCVYACVHSSAEKTVSVRRLLYIGEAADVRDRVQTHDQWSKWRNQLKAGEVLCVSAAVIAGESDRQRAEAAMIFKHKPPCNIEYVDAFPFDTTTVTTSGKNALMHASFVVQRTESPAAKAVAGYRRSWT